jgi:hypothetical protein
MKDLRFVVSFSFFFCHLLIVDYFSSQMARSIDFIKDNNTQKELSKLAVRVEDIWKSGIGRNEHLEFLILDKRVINRYLLLSLSLEHCLFAAYSLYMLSCF